MDAIVLEGIRFQPGLEGLRKKLGIKGGAGDAERFAPDPQIRLGGRIVIVDELCNDCGLCVAVCCGHAIVLGE